MLYKFKSQAAAEVLMLEPRAEEILGIIGKEPAPKGIVTVAQIAPAIAALKAEIDRREAERRAHPQPKKTADQLDSEDAHDDGVTLRARSLPFIQLLETSAAAGKDVVWGV